MAQVTLLSFAFAHPGHGRTDPASWRHYLIEPMHAFVLVAALIVIVFAVLSWRAARVRRSDGDAATSRTGSSTS